MHRADLVEMLASALPPGVVHTGHRGIGFEQAGDVARVSFANGASPKATSSSQRTASTRSCGTMRRRRRGRSSTAPSPIAACCRIERIPHWPTDRWQMWLGKGKHFLTFPVRAGRAHQLCRLRAGRRGNEGILVGARRSRRASARVRGLGSAHRDAAEPRSKRHSAGRSTTASRCRPGRSGRLTLLGDAAHPMLPHLGQGANQSIEDGMALATILAQCGARRRAGGAAGL